MPNLTTLEYKNGEDLSIVAVALPALKQISCDDKLDAGKLVKVATQLTQLESLTTSKQPTEALLKALAKLPSLKKLKFQRKLSEKQIMAINAALPSVALE